MFSLFQNAKSMTCTVVRITTNTNCSYSSYLVGPFFFHWFSRSGSIGVIRSTRSTIRATNTGRRTTGDNRARAGPWARGWPRSRPGTGVRSTRRRWARPTTTIIAQASAWASAWATATRSAASSTTSRRWWSRQWARARASSWWSSAASTLKTYHTGC